MMRKHFIQELAAKELENIKSLAFSNTHNDNACFIVFFKCSRKAQQTLNQVFKRHFSLHQCNLVVNGFTQLDFLSWPSVPVVNT